MTMRFRNMRRLRQVSAKRGTKRGTGLHRWAMRVLMELNNPRTWRRHPAPFAKTRAGRARRVERRFKIARQTGGLTHDR
jgi:hypothetical protein